MTYEIHHARSMEGREQANLVVGVGRLTAGRTPCEYTQRASAPRSAAGCELQGNLDQGFECAQSVVQHLLADRREREVVDVLGQVEEGAFGVVWRMPSERTTMCSGGRCLVRWITTRRPTGLVNRSVVAWIAALPHLRSPSSVPAVWHESTSDASAAQTAAHRARKSSGVDVRR